MLLSVKFFSLVLLLDTASDSSNDYRTMFVLGTLHTSDMPAGVGISSSGISFVHSQSPFFSHPLSSPYSLSIDLSLLTKTNLEKDKDSDKDVPTTADINNLRQMIIGILFSRSLRCTITLTLLLQTQKLRYAE